MIVKMLLLLLGLSCLHNTFACGNLSKLCVQLSNDKVGLDFDFKGQTIQVFGTKSPSSDIVVILKAKNGKFEIQKKSPKYGLLWLNTESTKLNDVYKFYNISTTSSLEDLNLGDLLKTYQIGLDNVTFIKNLNGINSDVVLFDNKKAFIEKMLDWQFYSEKYNSINSSDTIFNTEIFLPQNTAIGNYTLQVLMVENGQITESFISKVTVEQVGYARKIYYLAHDHKILYFCLTIIISIIAGFIGKLLTDLLKNK